MPLASIDSFRPRRSRRSLVLAIAFTIATLFPAAARASVSVSPDNGHGTVDMPPQCQPNYHCADGVPIFSAGAVATFGEIHLDNVKGTLHVPGGSLGGTHDEFTGGIIVTISGGGYFRVVTLPISVGQMDHEPRVPGQAIQPMAGVIVALAGDLPAGDPDFDLLRIQAGNGFGLPSPGHTTLTQLPGGNWAVDSFFDITFRIDFIGHTGGPFSSLTGVNTSVARFQVGQPPRTRDSAPDNGGTAQMPPTCPRGWSSDASAIRLNGLPPGEPVIGTLHMTGVNPLFEGDGGDLGGTIASATAKVTIDWIGSGALASFHRAVSIPAQLQMACGPRAPGTSLQSFPTEMLQLFGDLPAGDPDFDLLRIKAGTGFGMPSPGHTTLTRNPGLPTWSIDSFFDVFFEVDFIGTLTGMLAGQSGTTIGHMRIVAGQTDASTCLVPDNGGTAALPVNCLDGYHTRDNAVVCLNGLPPGEPVIGTLAVVNVTTTDPPGGGVSQSFTGKLQMNLRQVGTPFTKSASIPVVGTTASSPRQSLDATQSVDMEMVQLNGDLPAGDPDFDLLRITAGSGFGMPSPGHTTLTKQPGLTWSIDSFFDIYYKVEFIGHLGGPFSGLSGTTTVTDRFQAGQSAFVGVPIGNRPEFRVSTVLPNPARAISRVNFSLASGALVDAGVFDIAGRQVRSLASGAYPAGDHSLRWDGTVAGGQPAAPGLYFYRVRAGGQDVSRKVIVER